MQFFNLFGLIFITVVMIPNIIFAVKCKDGFENYIQGKWGKVLEIFEQIGRYGCFVTMIFNIPETYIGFPSDTAFAIYLFINVILVFIYCLIWIICFKKNNLFRGIALSVIPSVLFLFSGIISRSVLLIAAAIIFAPCHVIISVGNVIRKT